MLEPKAYEISGMALQLGSVDIRVDKGLIDALRLVIAGILLPHLLLETQPLLERVVQLRVRVADFLRTEESLKALAQPGA